MTPLERAIWFIVVGGSIPLIVYWSVMMGTYGFYHGRRVYFSHITKRKSSNGEDTKSEAS